MVERPRRHVGFGTATAAALALSTGAAWAQQPEQVWEAGGFEAPESALYDAERGVIYVSNVVGQPPEKDGQGYVSKLGPDGQVVERRWVTGLDAPKGMALHEGRLYVSDIDRLVAIDIEGGGIAESWDAPGAQFLNDVTVDDRGRVFVSDNRAGAIWKLEGGEFGVWMEGGELHGPNGLLAEGGRLVFAPWGEGAPGFLLAVPLDGGTIEGLGGEPEDTLDGVEPDGAGGYLVTDWVDGALFHFDPEGAKVAQLLDLDQGSADLEYIEDQKLAVIPMMMDGVVRAYRIE